MEYGLTAAILFHALNGLRVIAVDFWAKGPKYQRQMLWTVVTLWVLLMAGAFYPILQETLADLASGEARNGYRHQHRARRGRRPRPPS